ncbi:hypothetical protein [Aquimarina mytili]|uniref:DUF4064 domain-containing protein n=1 Tax=Aquimarina mytili TaxID=874423 RepID=A0A937D770_9FLAO|nr:hypothetical protein [Aquimarina mytili]MBL0682795.1 hypothetical protein [Aquimarina mytili]
MKKGILSIVIAFIGIFMVYLKNRNELIALTHQEDVTKEDIVSWSETYFIETIYNIYTIGAIILALLALLLGVISVMQKHKIGIIGITISISAIVLSFIPLWKYYVDTFLLQ